MPGIQIALEDLDIKKHNCAITIKNPATGNHRTFRVYTAKHGGLKGKRIVSLLRGQENSEGSRSWQGFGFVDEKGVYVWSKYRSTVYDTYAKMLVDPMRYAKLGAEYMVEGKCRCCNRVLTHPESIQTGVGPVCGGRNQKIGVTVD